MRAEEGGAHLNAPLLGETARGPQLPPLRLEVEPIAGFDLDRGYALGDQRVEARQGSGEQGLGSGEHRLLARGACRLDGRDNAASGPRHLLIARAREAKLELMGA